MPRLALLLVVILFLSERVCPDTRPPRIQLRAILIRCPYHSGYNTYKNKMEDPEVDISRDKEILQFYGFDVDEPLLHSEVVRCRRKLVVTIKLNNCGKYKKETEYVVIDHAYDPTSKDKIRLLNPIVLKIYQEPVMQTYPMNFIHVVNAEATEEVIHKGTERNYKGCSTQLYNPTCGLAHYNGKKIPFSEGFCCSCDSEVNYRRQPTGPTMPEPNSDVAGLMESGLMPQKLKNPSKKTAHHKKFKGSKCNPQSQIREKRLFPLKYYQIPSMEPAKGFLRSEFKLANGMDPWEVPAPDMRCRTKSPQKSAYNPFFHVLQKRLSDNASKVVVADKCCVDSNCPLYELPGNSGFFSDPASLDEPRRNWNISNNRGNFGRDNAGEEGVRKKRQVTGSGTQVRGGQDCIDRDTPATADPITYHESAHCLRFSELWYSVYNLREPFTSHAVNMDIFEKHCFEHRKNTWIKENEGLKVRVSTFQRRVTDGLPTQVFSYTPLQTIDREYVCLEASQAILLVPRPLLGHQLAEFPQPAEPSGRYLLLSQKDLSNEGDECDKVGVSFAAFAMQESRCERAKGTCLANQPLHMWQHDLAKKMKGEKGKYFLENFAAVPDRAIEESGGKSFLNLFYEGPHSSVIEIEYNADFNGILRKESTVQISEMYVDSTCEYHTRITVLVTNNGLVSSTFRPRMSNCPVTVPAIWSHEEGPPAVIPPQRNHVFRLSLYGPLPSSRFFCTIEILNSKRKIVALRRVRVQRYDRCLCMWHCLCGCSGSLEAFKCNPMSLEHFHAAGFYGSMSMDTSDPYSDKGGFSTTLFLGKLFTVSFGIQVFLLLFGLIKALAGLCFSRKIALYYLSLVCPNTVKDFEGESSQSKKRECYLRSLEFFYNTVFFLVIPGWLFVHFMRHLIERCTSEHSETDKEQSQDKLKKRGVCKNLVYIVSGMFLVDLVRRVVARDKGETKGKDTSEEKRETVQEKDTSEERGETVQENEINDSDESSPRDVTSENLEKGDSRARED